jgi:antirestriction protein ArdC
MFEQVEVLTGERFLGLTGFHMRTSGFKDHRWIEDYASIGCSIKEGQENRAFRISSATDGCRERRLYNLEQIDGGNFIGLPILPPVNQDDPIPAAASIIQGFQGCEIRYGGNRARYSLRENAIYVPEPQQFFSRRLFYLVLFHEMGHWGLTPERDSVVEAVDGDFQAIREIVAELVSLFLGTTAGIEDFERSAGYIGMFIPRIDLRQSNILSRLGEFAERATMRILDVGGNDAI